MSSSSEIAESRPFATSRRADRLAAAVVVLAVFAMYGRTVGYGFVFDDLSLIGPDGPRWLGNETLPYRPLRYASYWIDHAIGGGRAWSYHAANVFLHALVSVSIVRFARILGASALAAGLAGLAFAWHPLAVEVVAYVSGRRDLLSTLCGLAALSCWTQRSSLAATMLLLASVAAKEIGLLFLPLIALASMLGVGPPLRPALRVLLPVTLAAFSLPVAYGAVGPLAPSTTLSHQLSVAGRLAAHYAGGLFWPVGLSVEYPALAAPGTAGAFGPAVWAGLAALAAAVGFLIREMFLARKSSFAAVATAVVFLALSSVVGAHEPGADRHAYPFLAFCALASAHASARVPKRARKAAVVAALVVVVWFGVLAHRRIPVWADELSLWTATVATAPAAVRANHNLAGLLVEEGDLRGARRLLARARREAPGYAPAFLGQALVDCLQGRPVRGARWVEKARSRGADPAEAMRVAEECRRASER